MESTGSYWKPVFNVLEMSVKVYLANPHQVKGVPGRKTDARDSPWIAELLAHGLVRPSFVPPRETGDLRDLTRCRVKLTEERNRIHNRIHKVLEDASIKLDTIASDILGTSGRAIIEAIIRRVGTARLAGRQSEGHATGQAAGTSPRPAWAHHRAHNLMLHELMDDLAFVEGKIERLEKAIAPQADVGKLARLEDVIEKLGV